MANEANFQSSPTLILHFPGPGSEGMPPFPPTIVMSGVLLQFLAEINVSDDYNPFLSIVGKKCSTHKENILTKSVAFYYTADEDPS